MLASLYFLRTIPIGTGYAVWTGIGSILLIAAGIAVLKLGSAWIHFGVTKPIGRRLGAGEDISRRKASTTSLNCA